MLLVAHCGRHCTCLASPGRKRRRLPASGTCRPWWSRIVSLSPSGSPALARSWWSHPEDGVFRHLQLTVGDRLRRPTAPERRSRANCGLHTQRSVAGHVVDGSLVSSAERDPVPGIETHSNDEVDRFWFVPAGVVSLRSSSACPVPRSRGTAGSTEFRAETVRNPCW